MNLDLLPLAPEDVPAFKKDMQEAFQCGAESELSDADIQILPEEEIDSSLGKAGAAAYKAVMEGEIVGGAIVVVDGSAQRNHIDLLYVKKGIHSRGIGRKIWYAIEKRYPDTKLWETFTPYFEKRNIHFYINRCGFAAVEFLNPRHMEPKTPVDMTGGEAFFRLAKRMK